MDDQDPPQPPSNLRRLNPPKPTHPDAVGDILDMDSILSGPPPQIDWAINGILAEHDSAMLVGIGGIGKSYVLMEMALALSLGRPLFGRFPVKRAYRILYLDFEMHPDAVARRFYRMFHGAQLQTQPKTLHIQTDARLLLDRDDDPQRQKLMRFISTNRIDYVLMDSLRRTLQGDENSSDTGNKLFMSLRALRHDYGTGTVANHHVRKAKDDDKLNDPTQMARGTMVFRDNVDSQIGVIPGGKPNHLRMFPAKGRHDDDVPDSFLIRFDHVDPFNPDGPFRLVDAGDHLEGLNSEKVLDTIIRQPGLDMQALGAVTKLTPKQLRLAISQLLAASLVSRDETRYPYRHYPTTK